MNILQINTFDISGGAAIAAFRLCKGLQVRDMNCRMLVQFKFSDASEVIGPLMRTERALCYLRPHLDALPVRLTRNRPLNNFSPAMLPDNTSVKVSALKPDIIHMHWITGGFVRIETLRKYNVPIVWTLHDLWAFTGGCHYSMECRQYRESCGMCPVLGSKKEHDLSRKIWQRKQQAWKETDITVVAPSRWLAECARESSLFSKKRIEVIPNGINIETYKPSNREVARQSLGLPQDKQLILFGAVKSTRDKRKGFHLLKESLKKLSHTSFGAKVQLVVFGASSVAEKEDLGLQANYMKHVSDEDTLALLYAAADVFVAPSTQENLSNMVMESMACGTPVVAFNIGGMPDMIEHKKNGYLSKPFRTEDMTEGIAWVLKDKKRWEYLSERAREKVVENFSLSRVAGRHIDLYKEILLC